jgi:hypothetical protein
MPFVRALAATTGVREGRLQRVIRYELRGSAVQQLRSRGHEPPYFKLPLDVAVGQVGFIEAAKAVLLSFGDPDDVSDTGIRSRDEIWGMQPIRCESPPSPYVNWTEHSGRKGDGGSNWRDVE